MVTAIVIPIICLYFYWLTKKEMKEHDRTWITAGDVRHEAVLTGEIKSIEEEKERFYYHRYIYVQTIQLQTATKLNYSEKDYSPYEKPYKGDFYNRGCNKVVRKLGKQQVCI
jgi:hypothetical protein